MELTGIRQKVFLDRYALKDEAGAPIEQTPEQMWRRVSHAISKVEPKAKRAYWEEQFYNAMDNFVLVPGGRILSGAGSGYKVTFYNCFVIPSPHDSRQGILNTLSQMVEIMSRGGGVGINISSLRPRGSRVKKVNGFSSGPCNWAELFSVATKDIIQQGGCFAPGTRIMTHLGLVPIEEMVESKHRYFAATHQGYKEVTVKFDNGTKNVYEVTTASGLRVTVTAEHKFLTFNEKGEFFLTPLSDLKEGDQAVMLLGDWRDDVPLVPLSTRIPEPSKYSYGRKDIELPTEFTEDLAFLMGCYHADGSKVADEYSPNGKGIRIAMAMDRQKDLETLIAAIRRCFAVQPKLQHGDGAVWDVEIFSRSLNEYLTQNKLTKASSVTVTVPEQVFRSPKSVAAAYIAGVFLGDGTNRGGKGGLRITTVSHQFARELQLLLLNLGIASQIKAQERQEKGWRTLYAVTVNGATFMKRYAAILAAWTEKVEDHRVSVRDGAFGWPFNVVDRFAYLSNFQRTMARTNPTTSQKAALFLQEHASRIREADRPDVELLASCVPDTITAITPKGTSPVYDLEVRDTHLLSGNGFYTSNSRRGALMLMLWDWHPDVEEFITVKQDLSRINGANLSVCVSDSFMDAVKNDRDWDLVFPDSTDPDYDTKWDGYLPNWIALGKKPVVKKTIKARALWDLVAQAAWRSAEPGVVFMERYNKWFNNYYWEYVNCVNPCVTGDTLIATEYGWTKARDLTVGTKILTPKGLKPIDKVYNNGKQEIFEVKFSDGGSLEATADHKLRVVRGKKYEWIKVSDLKKNEAVVVVDRAILPQEKKSIPQEAFEYAKKNNLIVNSQYDRELGFLMGVTIGDGYFGKIGDKYGYRMKLCYGKKEELWGKVLIQALQKFGTEPRVVSVEHAVPYEDGTIGMHGSKQISLYKLANVLGLSGLPTKKGPEKHIPYELMNLSEDFQRGLLDGLFSTDGSVSMKAHDPMLRLSSVSKELLEQVRLLLLNFGIHSRIYKGFRRKTLYDGRDMQGVGYKYDLLVMNESIAKFYELIGLSHPEKAERLKQVAQEYYFMGGTNLARVLSVRDTGRQEDVYDVHEPETLTWVTNGYVSFDCGEEGLPNWGVCNLTSINLANLVNEKGEMDYKRLSEVAKIGVRFQDDVIDADFYVFEEIKKRQMQGERRIGLGTMGLGDALIKMKLRYGSKESLPVIDKIYQTIRDSAYEASVVLAAEKGPFPAINIKKHLDAYFIKQLPDSIRKRIKKVGVRNSVILQQAPTGSTSLMSGVSSGIEPVYEFEFIRRDRLGEHVLRHPFFDAWFDEFKKTNGRQPSKEERPDYFVSANDLTPEDHVYVQAAIQKYVDASISKTVNAPKNHTVEDVKRLYMLAYDQGCKGITYMRAESRPGVLTRVDEDKKETKKEDEVKVEGQYVPEVKPRPMMVHGATYQVETPVGQAYVTINTNGGNQPLEVFVNVGKAGSDVTAMAEAMGRLISLTLRLASPVSPMERVHKIAAELIGIGGARSLGFGENRVRSLPDAVAKVIDRHFGFFTKHKLDQAQAVSSNGHATVGNGLSNGHGSSPKIQEPAPEPAEKPLIPPGQQMIFTEKRMVTVDLCPSCGEGSLVFEESCKKCYSCGYSEC